MTDDPKVIDCEPDEGDGYTPVDMVDLIDVTVETACRYFRLTKHLRGDPTEDADQP